MYERAKYFRNKFIRNGIFGLVICVILIYSTVTSEALFLARLIILLIVSVVWLYFGLHINRKLKSKDKTKDKIEITDERISFKQVEFLLSILLIVAIFLGIRHVKYADYLAIPIVVAYLWWLYSQMKLLNNYFDE